MTTVSFTLENNNGLLSSTTEIDFETLMKNYILNNEDVKTIIQEKVKDIVKAIDVQRVSENFQTQLGDLFSLKVGDVANFQTKINEIYKEGIKKLESNIESSLSSFKFEIPKIKIEDVSIKQNVREEQLQFQQPNTFRNENNLYANEEIVTKVSIVDISDDTIKKMSSLFEGFGKERPEVKKPESQFESLGLAGGLVIGGIIAKKLADWIADQDLKELWKTLFNFITDSRYRKIIAEAIEAKFGKFISFFGEKWDDLFKAISNTWGRFFDDNKLIKRFKNSEWLSEINKVFTKIGDKLDSVKLVLKESTFGKVFSEFADNFTSIFNKVKDWFKIGGDLVTDTSKSLGIVGEVVKGGGVMSVFGNIGKFIADTPIGKFLKVLAKPGSILAKGTMKMIPFLGDMLSIYIGYDRIKNANGYLDTFQGVMDIVSGIFGLTAVGQPISIALDMINLTIDLIRWGTKKMEDYAVSQGNTGILDLIGTKLKSFGKDMVIGLLNLMPSFIRNMFEVGEDSSIKFKGVDYFIEQLDQVTGGLISGAQKVANETGRGIGKAFNWAGDKFDSVFGFGESEQDTQEMNMSTEDKPKARGRAKSKPPVKVGKDIIMDSGRVTYYQPDNSDKLINITSNTSAMAKENGFLDKKFDEMIKIMKDQAFILVESGNNLQKMLQASMETIDQLVKMNGVLPALAPIPPESPTTQFSDDASGNPIMDYRMRNYNMRGV